MFGVRHLEDAVECVKQHSGVLTMPFIEGGSCRSAMCMDTEGNLFGLHQRKT